MASINENINRDRIVKEDIRDINKETKILVNTLNEVNDSILDLGKILKGISRDLKISTSVQIDMAKEWGAITEDQTKSYKDILNVQSDIVDKQKESTKLSLDNINILDKIKNKSDKFIKNLKSIPETFIDDLLNFPQVFLDLDQVVTNVRQELGMLPKEGRHLFHTIKDTTIQMAHLGVTFKDVGNAIVGLSNEFTGIVAENKTLLETSVMLNKSFGISNEKSAKFLKTLAGITGTTASSQTNMAGFAKNIASASGVPLDQLMSDVANASDNVRMFVGDSADKMVKVAVEARMLGTSLSEAANTAKHFLNFESSINAELKASALLGRQINFNEARRMSFNKDTIGATKEILRLTKEVGFNQLNPIQQEAYAAAAGKSVTELQSMLQQEKNIQLIQSSGDKKTLERYQRYKDMLELSEDRAKDEGEIARLEMLKLSNQTRINALTDQFNQLILELQDPILEIVEPLMQLAVWGMPLLISGIKMFAVAMSGPVQLVKFLSEKFKLIKSFFGSIKSLLLPVFGLFKSLLSPVSKVFKFIKPLVSLFGRFSPFLFPIITGLTLIGSLMKNWASYVKKDGLLVGGFKAIGHALYDALIKPFVDAFKFIFPWLGQSPSEIGLSIVKGISSIGSLLFNAIISPWVMGYNWIQSSFIGKLIPGGTIKIPSLGIGGEDVSDSGSDSNKTGNKTSTSLNDIKVSNEVIASKIDELITLMANGGISVNLDGTRVNESLDTSRFNRGNRGIASSIS